MEAEGSPSRADLATLAAAINDEIRAADLLMFQSLERYRRVGELLAEAKGRVGHGSWGRFVADHRGFGTETASNYTRVFARWEEVEEMRGPNPQPAADLTLREVSRRLAGPRKKAAHEMVTATADGVESSEPELADRATRDAVVTSDPGGAAGTDARRPRPERADGPPAASDDPGPAVDPTRATNPDGAPPADLPEGCNDRPGATDAAIGDAPVDVLWEIKGGMLKKSGLLSLHRCGETFAGLGGLGL